MSRRTEKLTLTEHPTWLGILNFTTTFGITSVQTLWIRKLRLTLSNLPEVTPIIKDKARF